MTNSESQFSAWPKVPTDHPAERPDASEELERKIEPAEMVEATRMLRELLGLHRAEWEHPKNSHPDSQRQVDLPLSLEGHVTLREYTKNDRCIAEVCKYEMGETTIWNWDTHKGVPQLWRRIFMVPENPSEDIISEASKLKSIQVGDVDFTQLILDRLEKTLQELALGSEVDSSVLNPHDFITPEEMLIIDASYHPSLEEFMVTAFNSHGEVDPDEMDKVANEIKEGSTINDAQIDEAFERCKQRIFAQLHQESRTLEDAENSRLQLIEMAAQDPRIVALFQTLQKGDINHVGFMYKLQDLMLTIKDEYELTMEEMYKALDLANPSSGDEELGRG